MTDAQVIIAGFANDIRPVVATMAERASVFCVDESTEDAAELPKAKLVVYVFSPDTGYSSHLLSWFTWIHHHVAPPEERVLRLGNVNEVFPFARDMPIISPEELGTLLAPNPK